jgi:uncharacterized protein YjiS (DUF1127 family)
MPTMTNALASTHGRSRASAPEAGVDTVSRIRTAWKQYRAYRRTLSELRDLPARMLRDLDINRGDLSVIAHREVYGW